MTVWKATNSCTGTITPTAAPVFSNAQDGCPEEYDSNTVYEPSDKVSVTLDDGRIKVYSCKSIPYGLHCKDPTYMPGPGGRAGSDGITPLWETAWIYFGGCTGTYNPTMAPVFAPGSGGCPEEYDDGTNYESGDEVTVIGAGETYGKIYKCKRWPESDYCKQAEYAPVPGGRAGSDGITPLWKEAWMYVGGCTGTITPTAAPVFAPGSTGGCPEEFDGSTDYVGDDEVAVIGVGETWGKIYKCKGWPHVDRCNQAGYEPGLPGPNGESLWKEAWMYVGGCTGTITPTASPMFRPGSTGGCPEEYVDSTDYVEGDEVAIIGAGETYGKIYECKGWPGGDHCKNPLYAPGPSGQEGPSGPLWKIAWEYVGGCTGTITPTAAPVFKSSDWEKDGCPEEYEPNNASYEAGDYVSVPKNAENTRGIVYQCKSGNTSPWCQQENYAPYTEIGSAAWKRVGVCTGTISPTAAPSPLSANSGSQLCQFKYPLSSTPTLETSTNKEYVVLQAGSWQSNAQIDTVTGGESLLLNRAGNLVRCGRDARQCTSGYPYSAWCLNNSPFEPSSQCENSNSDTYNWYQSPLGWKQSTCVDVVSKNAVGTVEANDLFVVTTTAAGPVFASNGDMLVEPDGTCVNLAINSGDYFKPASTVKGCQKCLEYSSTAVLGGGFGSPAPNEDKCTPCAAGTKSAIVDGKSQCVCDNGSTDPWDAIGVQCQNCPGEKYLGAVVNSAGDGVCEPACPTGHSFYTTYVASTVEFKFCCKYSGCLNQAGTATGTLADCYDGTVGGPACALAGLTA